MQNLKIDMKITYEKQEIKKSEKDPPKNVKTQLGNLTNKKFFYFEIRESPAPLNIPTPTPTPDWGGPVACLSGPSGVERDPLGLQDAFLVCGSFKYTVLFVPN